MTGVIFSGIAGVVGFVVAMSNAPEEITDRIKRLTAVRKQLGWSEEACAHHLGVTYSTLNRWERGQAWPRSRVVLMAIDQFLQAHEEQRAG